MGCLAVIIFIVTIALTIEINETLGMIILVLTVIGFTIYGIVNHDSIEKENKQRDYLKNRYRNSWLVGGRYAKDVTGDHNKDMDYLEFHKKKETVLGRKLTPEESYRVELEFASILEQYGIGYEGFYMRQKRIVNQENKDNEKLNDIFK